MMRWIIVLMLGWSMPVYAFEECLTLEGSFSREMQALIPASAYRVWWLKTGQDVQPVYHSKTQQLCVRDPQRPIADVLTLKNITAMIQATLDHRNRQRALNVQHAATQTLLQQEVDALESSIETLTPSQERILMQKRIRLERLQNGKDRQDSTWIDPVLE